MSEYIFKPPPPPPSKQPIIPSVSSVRRQNHRDALGVYNRSQGRGRGTYHNQQQGNLGPQNSGIHGQFNGRGLGPISFQRHQGSGPHFQPRPPSVTRAPHLNPAFFPQPYQQLQDLKHEQPPLLQPIYSNPSGPAPYWATNYNSQHQSYAQEALNTHLTSRPTQTSYNDVLPPSISSYGHFNLDPGPVQTKITKTSKPDMPNEEWLALNGGLLIGTNIKPPETDDEIKAWIAERKSRYPTRARTELKAQEESERQARAQQRRANGEQQKKKDLEGENKHGEEKLKEIELKVFRKKRKRDTSGAGSEQQSEGSDSNAAPEEISIHTCTAFRDDRQKKAPKIKEAACRQFRDSGSCPRGLGCNFRHEPSRQGKKKDKKMLHPKEKDRFSLYQKVYYLFLSWGND
jgi:hypothetical protein